MEIWEEKEDGVNIGQWFFLEKVRKWQSGQKKRHQMNQSDLQTERETWPNISVFRVGAALRVITGVTRIYVTCNSNRHRLRHHREGHSVNNPNTEQTIPRATDLMFTAGTLLKKISLILGGNHTKIFLKKRFFCWSSLCLLALFFLGRRLSFGVLFQIPVCVLDLVWAARAKI